MLIAANKAVSIDYTLTNDAGEVIDSSAGGAPLSSLLSPPPPHDVSL